MKINNASITILINRDCAIIELHDHASGITFLNLQLTPAQLTSALSRLSRTPVESMEVKDLDKLNKKMEVQQHEFEIPDYGYQYRQHLDDIKRLAIQTCPEGWQPDEYYGSQNSFFEKDGKRYARVVIRRWVDETLLNEREN